MVEPNAVDSNGRSALSDRFGAGLTETEVRRFQTILREQCGVDVGLPEVWSRANQLLSLVEVLLKSKGVLASESVESTGFALPRS
jgi:hypothetical protein